MSLINHSLRSLVPGVFLSNSSLCVVELAPAQQHQLLGAPPQSPAGLCSIALPMHRCSTETHSLSPQTSIIARKNCRTNWKKPRAGPGLYGPTLLLMDSWLKEEEKGQDRKRREAGTLLAHADTLMTLTEHTNSD